ncbi:M23 family metallopeptidase [Streptomyces caniscabiei]|uniref:M23 family metallopeptidase n=1 Tax=Streptomyces caniscabiei TaxID=2746961 RepID=A0A927QIN2_9ACTN|nr:M23 family metallopeptidase [Streptomyces caniscabiei]MBD9722054.1 M23 family metallopeptidase [Streptomyces caniscabiei]MDX3509248.1 M23 family metallopeptidase [Streptomyces caniscabiei]MDX3716999.1 M23 family metallopeptidase [Streptomyces caniscabiei]WEO22868.1 M23 family metallopeptidase [Streptomyces caniscabiei]
MRFRRGRGPGRAAAALAVFAALLTTLVATAPATSAAPGAARSSSAAAAARPDFKLPFACGETWQLQTYLGHAPDDKKLDMYRVDGNTLGARVAASAAGTVTEWFEPGGLEINHGNGWFTVYLHMDRRDVRVGQQVAGGATLGRLGLVGTTSAHLHYEQLYDTNGDNNGENDEIVHPVIQGTEYRLSPDGNFPQVTSTNACGSGGGGGGGGEPARYWVDTFADATGYAAVDCVGDTRPACAPQGKLYKGTNYVLCKKPGDEVRVGASYNHYWLLTDLDEVVPGGKGHAYVSAYYLERWGNDEAKDNDGVVIRTCRSDEVPR